MKISDIPFLTTDWATVEATAHPGAAGLATWRTRQFGSIRVRMVQYSAGYRADHWCTKGHVVLVVKGVLVTELLDGRTFTLTSGQSYQVGDGCVAHRSISAVGATLFVVD